MGSGMQREMIEKREGGAEGGCERSAGVMAVKMRVFGGERGDESWRG